MTSRRESVTPIGDARSGPRLNPRAPLQVARTYAAANFIRPGGTQDDPYTLLAHRGDWRRWDGSAYPQVEDAGLRSGLYLYLDTASTPDGDPFNPTARRVTDCLDALKAICHLDERVIPPAWLDQGHVWSDVDPARLIPAQGMVINPKTGNTTSATPMLYVTRALPHRYDPNAPPPKTWFKFLNDIFPEDPESIEALRRWFAYCLTQDTRLQIMLWLIGQTRGGKGLIARVLRALLGDDAVAGPSLVSFTETFGIEPLVDRPLAIIDDARVPNKDATVATERLLTIVGEGLVTVPRKWKGAWSGRLPTRIMLLANELPRLPDTSGAIVARTRILHFKESWVGREDLTLGSRLEDELPGILRWAVEGYRNLVNDGFRIPQPATGAELLESAGKLNAPIREFIEDHLRLDPEGTADKKSVYQAFQEWCHDHGARDTPEHIFARDLIATLPNVRQIRPAAVGPDGKRDRLWKGFWLL